LSDALEWLPSSGRGVLYSFSVVTRASEAGIATPYVLALVDLEEGPRLMTHLVDCPIGHISIGMPVTVRFTSVSDAIALPVFAPVVDAPTGES